MANTSYTFLNMVEANGKNDKKFINVTVGSVLLKFETHESNGKKFVTATMPINGRAKAINGRFGTNYAENDTIWANVVFWEDRADRFLKMMDKLGKPDRVRLVVVGAIGKNEFQKKDGSTGVTVRINVNDWMLIGSPNQNQTNDTNSVSPAAQTNPADDNDGFDDEGFVDFDGTADDLPF